MRTNVNIKVPDFEGGFSCTVGINELKHLAEVLSELKRSIGRKFETTWCNMEGNVEFTFNLEELGGLTGSYKFSSNNYSIGSTLSGDFEADQTFIDIWLKQAKEALANVS